MYHVTQLKSGLRVATAEMPHMNSVSVGVWVALGSRYETAELNGVCHFIEHLLFKGTATRTAREISEAIEGVGGYLNAFTAEESTCFHAKASHERFDSLLEVLTDMLLNSKMEREDIDKEREVIKEEIAMYLDEPQHQVQEVLNAMLWPDQPLGRPITGTRDTLDALKQPLLRNYLRENYTTANTLIVAAGKVTHRHAVRLAEHLTRRFQSGAPAQFAPARAAQTRPLLKLVSKKTEQTQIALGLRTCDRHDDRRFAVRMLNTIIGENMSSRLFQTIREDRGLAYSIYSTPSFFADTGDLVISAGLDANNLPETLRLITLEFRRCREQSLTKAELQRARDYLIGQIDLSLENTESQMNWLGEQLTGYGRIYEPNLIKRRLRQVTAREIQAAARDFLRPERFNLALVSPLKSTNHLLKCLR